ncbi:AAA family ATPase [Eubacteriaceae bacterium ES3]|nr:AAA family ATPase [Eubacteriaceae bacterium ES3]
MDKIKVMIIGNNENRIYEIKSLLKADRTIFVGYTRNEEGALTKSVNLQPNVVILQCEDEYYESINLAEKIYIRMPGCSVFLICDNFDTAYTEKVMQAGIRKVLQFPIDTTTLTENIETAYFLEKSRMENVESGVGNSVQSQVITVFGTKGGIGRTTVAVNLAVALSKKGKKVAIIDADLQFGDVNVFFDMDPKETIADLTQGKDSSDMDAIRRVMGLHFSGVNIICAPKSPEYAEYITPEMLDMIIDTMRPFYDYVIVDTAPVFNDISMVAIENANLLLCVAAPDISTLRNTKIALNVLDTLQQREKAQIIVNRFEKSLITIKDMQRVLGVPLKNTIHADWKTALNAHNKGVPILLGAAKTGLGRELTKIVDFALKMLAQR